MATDNLVSKPYYQQQQDAAATEKNNSWTKMMQMMAMLPKLNDQQMIGYALGKLLRSGFDEWKDNYDARGKQKYDSKNQQVNSDTVQPIVNQVEQQNVNDAMGQIFGGYSPQTTPYNAYDFNDANGITNEKLYYDPSTGTTAVERATQSVVPDMQWYKDMQKLNTELLPFGYSIDDLKIDN